MAVSCLNAKPAFNTVSSDTLYIYPNNQPGCITMSCVKMVSKKHFRSEFKQSEWPILKCYLKITSKAFKPSNRISICTQYSCCPHLIWYITQIMHKACDLFYFGTDMIYPHHSGLLPGTPAKRINNPDNKVHGAKMGPYGADRIQVVPVLAPWTLLSGKAWVH